MKSQPLAQPTLVGIYDIDLHGEMISYTLKRSSRAKLIWLGIKRQSGLTVTIPHNYCIRDLPEYLKSNSRWILRNISKFYNAVSREPEVSLSDSRSTNTFPDGVSSNARPHPSLFVTGRSCRPSTHRRHPR